MRRYRDIRFKFNQREWEQLVKLKTDMHCKTWEQFMRKLLDKSDEIIRLFGYMPP